MDFKAKIMSTVWFKGITGSTEVRSTELFSQLGYLASYPSCGLLINKLHILLLWAVGVEFVGCRVPGSNRAHVILK